MKIITFVSGKGGSGKTAIVANLGYSISKAGYNVLLIDWDFFTRGLSYYILEGIGQIEKNAGLIEAFENNTIEQLSPVNVRNNLDILTPTKNTRRVITFEDTSDYLSKDNINNNWLKLKKLISKGKYDFVFIDTHSGTEYLSLAPTFYSDEYIIVCEEDRTSWRVAELVRDTIQNYNEEIDLESKFGGFILNQTVGPSKERIIKFLEKEVLLGKCIESIQLDYRVRKAFARDKLVVEEYPNSSFNNKIRNISEKYLNVDLPSRTIFDGLPRLLRFTLRDPLLPVTIMGLYMYILSKELFQLKSETSGIFSMFLLTMLGLIFSRSVTKYNK